MSDIKLINKAEATSTSRKLTETGVTGFVWGLWFYMLLPVINVLLWVVGLATINRNFFANDGYLEFLKLVQEMGLVILIAFVIMRLWGFYNYYRFGRLVRRSHESSDSIAKLSNFYQMKPPVFIELGTRKEIIWPLKDDTSVENVGVWLQVKEKQLSPDQMASDEGTIMMQFRDVGGDGMPSIPRAVLMSLTLIFVTALMLLFAAGVFQQVSR